MRRLLFISGLLLAASAARADNWTFFRGSAGDAICRETQIPAEWGAEKNIKWKTPLPGQGHSSPVVWEGRVFVTAAIGDGHDRRALCFDAADGKEIWSKTAVMSADLENHNEENNFASSTPCLDARALYTSFYGNGRVTVTALDHDGNELWRADPLPFKSEHGYAHTPAQTDDLVILSVDQWAEPAIIALDKKTGAVRWRFDTPLDMCSNVPPLVVPGEGGGMVITAGNSMTRAFRPETGELIWSYKGPTEYCAAAPVFTGSTVMISGGYPDRRSVVIDATGHGDVTDTHLKWDFKKASTYVPSALYKDGYFFMVNDNGVATCLDAKTGDVKWQERIGGHVRSSLLWVEGNIWMTSDEGITTVYRATPEKLDVVRTNKLEGLFYATPAISNGRVFIRSGDALYCVGK